MGKGIGRGMLKDAVLRAAGIGKQLGIRALLCHAISEEAKAFYLKHGFVESPLHAMTLLLPLGNRSVP
jgi:GNAT superfamily N-acetyltransferase